MTGLAGSVATDLLGKTIGEQPRGTAMIAPTGTGSNGRSGSARSGSASTRVRGKGSRQQAQSGAFSIGRDDTNDIVVEDSSVSRCHAELRVDANDIVLVDLESLNGTHIREDGRWIEIARASVKAGEPILLGEVVITPEALLSRIDPARKPSSRSDRQALQSRTATGRPLDQRAPGQPGDAASVAETAGSADHISPPAHRLIQRPASADDFGGDDLRGDDLGGDDLDAELDIPSIRSNAAGARPRLARKRSRRVVMAAILALLFVSGGIGVITWVLAQPERAVLDHDATGARAATKR